MGHEFIIHSTYGDERCRFKMNRYADNNSLCLSLEYWDKEMKYWGPYDHVSTNLPDDSYDFEPEETSIFVRNDKDYYGSLKEVFESTGLARFTGNRGHSGFCTYDEWVVDVEKLQEIVR